MTMTLVHSNVFDDFMLSLDDPMPAMPNEYHDSITTPVLVTQLDDHREASIIDDKIQQYNLTINLFEVKLIQSDNQSITLSSSASNRGQNSTTTTPNTNTTSKVNLQLKIEVGDQKAKTGRKSIKLQQSDQSVVFNETFTFNFNTVLSSFLDNNIEFRLIQTGKYIKGTKILGKIDFDLISLYNEPGMSIKDHSLALFSEQLSELIGYVKCDLLIDLPNVEQKETLLPIIRPVTPLARLTPIEPHLKTMSIKVNIYSGEMPLIKTRTKDKLVSRIRSKKTSGLCVSITLGDLEGITSSVKRFSSPTWNESITFNTTLNVDKPPPLVIKVHDKLSGSTNFKPLLRTLDLSKMCLDSDIGPIYGPSYLTVKEVTKDSIFSETCLSGRLLVSIRSREILPSKCSDDHEQSNVSIGKASDSDSASQRVDNDARNLNQEDGENSTLFNTSQQMSLEHSVSCSPIDPIQVAHVNYPKEEEFTFLGVLYSSDMILKKLESRKISYEVDIGFSTSLDRCTSPSLLDLTLNSIMGTTTGSTDGGDEKTSLHDKTTPARSTPIKGYNDQENAKLAENLSNSTSTSKTSEKSNRSSITSEHNKKSDTSKSTNIVSEKSSVTTPMKPVAHSDSESGNVDYLTLPLENTKPLLGIEQMLIDCRHRASVYNMVRRIRLELEIGLTDVREMALINHSDTCRRFRGVLEDLMVNCNRFLALTVMPSKYPKNELDLQYTKCRQKELIKLSADAKNTLICLNENNLSETLSTVTGYLGRLEVLLLDPQDGFPDIMIYLLADGKRIGYLRIPVADVIFSRLQNEKGLSSGKVLTYYIRSIKHPELVLNRISFYSWFGLKRHKRYSTIGLIPGYEESLQLVFFQSLDGALPAHLIYPDQQ